MSIERQNFQQTLTYTIQTNHLTSILQDLNEVRDMDRLAENRNKRYKTFIWSGFAGAILSCFLLTFLLPVAIILAIIFVTLAIVGFVLLKKRGHLDIPNYRYELTQRILKLIDRDRQETSDVHLQILFSSPNQANKKVSTIQHPTYSQIKKDLYRDQWLKLEGEFLDRTQFNLTATEKFQTVYGWKRGSSGKMKYKTKSKSKGQLIQLSLKIPLRRYGAIQVLKSEAETAIQLPAEITQKRLTFTDKSIVLTVKTPAEYQNTDKLYQTISMMFLSLYQVLNLANLLSNR